jgi:hypothetical protein
MGFFWHDDLSVGSMNNANSVRGGAAMKQESL